MSPAGVAYVLNSVQSPPAFGSDKAKEDLQGVLNAQAARTPDRIKEVQAEEKFTAELMTTILGPVFTAKNYPVTCGFLKRIEQEEGLLSDELRLRYKRNRPYEGNPQVKSLFHPNGYDYPAKMASAARIMLLVLVELFPEKIPDLLAREAKLAQSGVDAGVNYPSDVVAGRAMAHALIFVIHDTPDFQHDMAEAKAEILARKRVEAAKR